VKEATMSAHAKGAVVVGVDGSDASQAALAHGAWEAHRRGRPLRLVHGLTIIGSYGVLGLPPDVAGLDGAADAARQTVGEMETRARLAYPNVEVTSEIAHGSGAAALVDASIDAVLVVVGSRGLGGFAGLMLGSVGTQLAAHSHAPVLVIRPPDAKGNLGAGPPHRPVLVGIDGIPDSDAALSFAFDEASARGVPLQALYAWWLLEPSNLGPIDKQHYDLLAAEDEARRMLAEATAGWCDRYPEVEVELIPAHSMNPTVALLDASQDAGLLVVSRHGGNALTRLLLGSVGDIAVREAPCPVAVVPEAST
jgi:nucleotide-binding universal stress UspA family protein